MPCSRPVSNSSHLQMHPKPLDGGRKYQSGGSGLRTPTQVGADSSLSRLVKVAQSIPASCHWRFCAGYGGKDSQEKAVLVTVLCETLGNARSMAIEDE
jgi:hypothetical protein